MAVFPTKDGSADAAPAPGTDVEAWTEQTVHAMGTLSISGGPVVTGTSVTLDIPLDERVEARARVGDNTEGNEARAVRPGYVRRREPLRRDSLKRREALLKGKEGSRRRQKWENDRLLGNPYVQPPLPMDWEVRPTYPVHTVPYFLASLWDAELAARSAKKREKAKATGNTKRGADTAEGNVPKELRETLKRARGAKGLLYDLEEEVRKFVETWEEKKRQKQADNLIEPDSEDEEIVFVGRNGRMHDLPSPTELRETVEPHKLVFDSLADDHGASFGRWLVHSIGDYYGLDTWSVTVGNPARREAYVGIKETKLKAGRGVPVGRPLPRPLWGMV